MLFLPRLKIVIHACLSLIFNRLIGFLNISFDLNNQILHRALFWMLIYLSSYGQKKTRKVEFFELVTLIDFDQNE